MYELRLKIENLLKTKEKRPIIKFLHSVLDKSKDDDHDAIVLIERWLDNEEINDAEFKISIEFAYGAVHNTVMAIIMDNTAYYATWALWDLAKNEETLQEFYNLIAPI